VGLQRPIAFLNAEVCDTTKECAMMLLLVTKRKSAIHQLIALFYLNTGFVFFGWSGE
jgi:hypothetical protein